MVHIIMSIRNFFPWRSLHPGFILFFLSLLLINRFALAAVGPSGNPHYNKIGFFDVHICNWPNQPLFLKTLFSTTHFDEIKKIQVFDNNKQFIGQLDLTKYRLVELKKPRREKRVFIKDFAIPKTSGNGWYSTKVFLKDGQILTAKDYVIIYKMDIARGIRPAPGSSLNKIPKTLSWNPVPGAKYYQIFIHDLWTSHNLYSSDLLTTPSLKLPKNLLKPGGAYCWLIHARDTNEDVLLGDFNHGSLTKCFEFDIK